MKTNGPSKKFQTKPCKEGSIELDKKNISLEKNSKFQKNCNRQNKENIQIYPFIDSWQRGKKGVFMTTMMFLLVWIAALSMAQDCLTVKDELELVSRKNISLEIWNLQLI